jgi:hypothetical protein
MNKNSVRKYAVPKKAKQLKTKAYLEDNNK